MPGEHPPLVKGRDLLKDDTVVLLLAVAFLCSMALNFIEPVLQPVMSEVGFSPTHVGLAFALISLAYSLGAPLCGWVE